MKTTNELKKRVEEDCMNEIKRQTKARASAVIEEHAVLLDALLRRDPVAAELAMVAHIDASHRARLQQLALRMENLSDLKGTTHRD